MDKILIQLGQLNPMVVLLVLGSIMMLGGIGIYILGNRRGVPNAWLWALFPVGHGLHEYAEYALDELSAPFIVERFEVLFAIGSSLVLLAACIEFLGAVSRPYGKLAALVGSLFVIYLLFGISEAEFENLEHISYQIGVFEAPFFRFFFGTILVIISIIAILISYVILKMRERDGQIQLEEDLGTIILISSFLLLLFAFFEGFESDNDIFITLRGISAVLFLLVPAYVLISSKLGLQILLITHETKGYVFGYDFNEQSFDTEQENRFILTSNFISAISAFSSTEMMSELSEISTVQGSYIFARTGKFIVALLTRNSTNLLENNLVNFAREIGSMIQTDTDSFLVEKEKIKAKINDSFYFV